MAFTEGTANLPTDTGGNTLVGAVDGTNFYILRMDNSTAKNLATTLRDAAGAAIKQDGSAGSKKLGISLYGNTATRGDTAIQAAIITSANTEDEADNAAVTITLTAAGAGLHNYISAIHCGFSAAPAATKTVTVTDDSTGTPLVVYRMPVVAAGALTFNFVPPLMLQANKQATIVLAASGTGGVIGYLNVMAFTDV